MPASSKAPSNRLPQWIGDFSGAFADLGTFLPLIFGLLVLGSYDPTGLLTGFGIFAIATGIIYRRPVPVQPMKAIAALAITGGMTAASVTASGLIIGAVLIILGVSGIIYHLQRLVPKTILFGIQLGLGLSLIIASAELSDGSTWLGLGVLTLLAALQFTSFRALACLGVLAAAIGSSVVFGGVEIPAVSADWRLPPIHFPGLPDFVQALETGVLPQLALTITNAVLLTAAIASDYFPEDRSRMSARNLALSSGGLNMLLAPFGAIPMCHGAGGLAAHYGQGARTGLAPVVFGMSCLALAIFAGPNALVWISLVPLPVIAALLAFAGFQLMSVRRLTMLRPACLTITGVTALTCVLVNIAAGLLVGLAAELIRSRLKRNFTMLAPRKRT